ncbi:Fmu (Sun) domain-containing protein [Chitinophaga horti]|uniref:Fmu (Sun) domain-containing protein n=1 Tax=Chitinophaga horti TaxID=2920382 RepID=A0ABY6IWQ5_9BACT|nr:Fmu (Sun) domain-containing protein [Chitinophaga horti]UYQ91818.1 Fmu (Sun) domain-containing protein [Chitinophaga horti]
MTRWENYLLTTKKILDQYNGSLPLHHFLKTFFKANPQMGSRDRKQISQLVYNYFRLGHWNNATMQRDDRILIALFLCEIAPNPLLEFFRPAWNAQTALSLKDKLQFLELPAVDDVFPFAKELSDGIDAAAYSASFLQQPHLYIRARYNKQQDIIQLLEKAGISYALPGGTAIALPNGTKVDAIITDKSWYEIQDLSSQETGQLLQPAAKSYWWDCCAASGGKSILLKDIQPNIELLVSDVRTSILENLQRRFKEAGIKNYHAKVLDLTDEQVDAILPRNQFDNILLDAPCSGSGTWGRTPENLYYFETTKIEHYQSLQKRIASNVVKCLKPGGALVYITCSVFRKENEEVVAYIEKELGLQLQQGGVIKGYDRSADTMFAARFVKV